MHTPNAAQLLSVLRSHVRSVGYDRVELTTLRGLVWLDASEVDAALIELMDAGLVVAYRNDRTASLTAADHDAALIVGGCPRHIVYLLDAPVAETVAPVEIAEQIDSVESEPASASTIAFTGPTTTDRQLVAKIDSSANQAPAIGQSEPTDSTRPRAQVGTLTSEGACEHGRAGAGAACTHAGARRQAHTSACAYVRNRFS